jgi:hypothetical protein
LGGPDRPAQVSCDPTPPFIYLSVPPYISIVPMIGLLDPFLKAQRKYKKAHKVVSDINALVVSNTAPTRAPQPQRQRAAAALRRTRNLYLSSAKVSVSFQSAFAWDSGLLEVLVDHCNVMHHCNRFRFCSGGAPSMSHQGCSIWKSNSTLSSEVVIPARLGLG